MRRRITFDVERPFDFLLSDFSLLRPSRSTVASRPSLKNVTNHFSTRSGPAKFAVAVAGVVA
jgi:hypothetical protein